MLAGFLKRQSPPANPNAVPVFVNPTAAELGSILRDPTNARRAITLLGQREGNRWAAASRDGALHHELIDWLVAQGFGEFDPRGMGLA